MLGQILDEEEEKERLALAEANRWRKWQEIINSKGKFIAKAKRRADVELRSALDAAGQVYVFGGGTYAQFDGFAKTDMSTKSYQQDGFEKMRELWHRRVRPGDTDMSQKGKGVPDVNAIPVDVDAAALGIEVRKTQAPKSYHQHPILTPPPLRTLESRRRLRPSTGSTRPRTPAPSGAGERKRSP